MHGTAATASDVVGGELNNNILIVIIRFNNNHLTHGPPRFLPTRSSSRRGLLPPLLGGTHHVKSLLFSPYPAIPPYVVRTPHPGMTDDHEHSRAQRPPRQRCEYMQAQDTSDGGGTSTTQIVPIYITSIIRRRRTSGERPGAGPRHL